jgi:hypothetical protein
MANLTGIALGWSKEGQKEGQLELVATSARDGSRDTVWHAQQTDPDRNEWTAWERFGSPGGGAGAPAVLQREDGLLDLLVKGRDQSIWRRFQVNPGRWSPWDKLGAPDREGFLGSLAFTQNKDGRLEVFVDRQGELAWHRWQQRAVGEADWSVWDPFGLPNGRLFGSLAVGRDSQSRLVAFAPAAAPAAGKQELWHRWQRTPGSPWSPWTTLKSPPGNRGPGEAVLGTNADGRLEVFTVASDGTVWHRWQQRAGDPESWEKPWDPLGAHGGGFREVAAGMDATGRLTLVATSQNGRDLFQLTQVTPGGHWGSWSPLPSVPTEAAGPLLYLNSNGGLGLFLRTPDTGGLHQLIQPEPDASWTPGPPWLPPS